MVWNVDTWNLVRVLDGHSDQVTCICGFESRLVSGSDDGTIKLWNTETWSCEVTLHRDEQASGVLCLAVCGGRLLSGTSIRENDLAAIMVWDTQYWTCEHVIEAHKDTLWALLACDSPAGEKLISACVDGTVRVWSTDTWHCEQTLESHSEPVYTLATLDGKILSGSHDETVVQWVYDPLDSRWKKERVLQSEQGVWAMTIWNDRLVCGLCDHSIKIWR